MDNLDIPTFLHRGHPGCVAVVAPLSAGHNEITMPEGNSRKRRKAPVTCAALRGLGYSTYAIAKMTRAEGERIAAKRIAKGE